jgi:hypothetical protein
VFRHSYLASRASFLCDTLNLVQIMLAVIQTIKRILIMRISHLNVVVTAGCESSHILIREILASSKCDS